MLTLEAIKPYYKDPDADITIYNGDCLEIMKEFPDKSFDLVLTDPPCGIGADDNPIRGNFVHKSISFDKERPKKEYFYEMIRLSRNQIIWGGNYFTDYLFPSPCWIVWNKRVNFSLADSELAWTSFDTAVRRFDMSVTKAKSIDGNFHPTQKPNDLMMWLLEKYSQDTETILDPFLGSGTTLVACKELHRRGVGIEISEKYCEIAVKRLKNTIVPMF